jgi:hypothetical protein
MRSAQCPCAILVELVCVNYSAALAACLVQLIAQVSSITSLKTCEAMTVKARVRTFLHTVDAAHCSECAMPSRT